MPPSCSPRYAVTPEDDITAYFADAAMSPASEAPGGIRYEVVRQQMQCAYARHEPRAADYLMPIVSYSHADYYFRHAIFAADATLFRDAMRAPRTMRACCRALLTECRVYAMICRAPPDAATRVTHADAFAPF